MQKRLYTFYLLFFISFLSESQVSVKDSSISTPFLGVTYGYYIPSGDMAKRFGNSSSLQMNLDLKSKKKITIGINGSYFFGNNIKENLFDSISSPGGYIINKNGEFADVRLYERGFTTSITLGRIFTFKKPNPNSGILFNIGFGFMQHKIRIESIGNNAPQLSKQYKKGYDHLTNGFLLSENIGYLYLSSNRLANFYLGFECMQGFTRNRRSFDYDTMQKDTKKRIDILYGAKFSWILPLYKKAPQEFYTY